MSRFFTLLTMTTNSWQRIAISIPAYVTAISTGQVVYAPNDTYTNESIITYTEIFNSLADAFEAAKK